MRSFVLSRGRKADYPSVFQEIKEMIGDQATAKLVAQHGGGRLYIPGTLKPEHPLFQLLGQENARRLSGEFGGLRVEIPLAFMLRIEQRNKLILADCAAGMSQRELALKYHLTERSIRNCTRSTKKGR